MNVNEIMAFRLVLCLFVMIAPGQSASLCVFDDSAGSQHQLDLSSLVNKKLEQTDDLTPPNIYQFTPCRNGIYLEVCAPHTAMAVKLQSYQTQCFIMAIWNKFAQETLPSYDGRFKRWTFNYSSVGACNGSDYRFLAHFGCDQGITDFVVVSAGTPRKCTSEMFISTRHACVGSIHTTPTPQDSAALSGGSVFVLLVFVGFSVYFVIGYIICAISNTKDHGFCDVNANIPNRAFWQMLPLLVITGCIITKEFFYELFCPSADNGDHLIRNEDENANPFAKASMTTNISYAQHKN